MFRRTTLLALVTAVVAAPASLSPPAASTPLPTRAAAGSWGPVTQLDRGEITLTDDALAIGRGGATTAVWNCSLVTRPCTSRLPRGGTWAPRTYLGRGGGVRVVVDGDGIATATWHNARGVLTARRRPGHDWSAPTLLDKSGWGPDLVVGRAGRVTVAWTHRGKGAKARIRAAVRPITGGWGTPVNVTPTIGASEPQVGVDAQGVVTVLYAVGDLSGQAPRRLQSRWWSRTSGWSAPVELTDRSVAAQLATNGAGDALVAFQRGPFTRLRAVVRPAGGSWGAVEVISPAAVDYLNDFAAAFDGDRSALVVWARDSGRVDLVRRPPEGGWSAPTQLAKAGAGLVELRTDAAGDAVVVWGQDGLYSRYRPAGGAWAARQTVAARGDWPIEDLSVALGASGDVVALWSREETFRLKARVFTVGP